MILEYEDLKLIYSKKTYFSSKFNVKLKKKKKLKTH